MVAAGYTFTGGFVLLLAVISLFIGPALYQWLRRGGFIAKAFDSLILVALVALVALLLIPESWAELGFWSAALFFAGYLLPGLLEGLIKRAAHTLHLISLLLALAGLALHAMLDGAALSLGGGAMTSSLAAAIVLHRFGVGLMLWMMVQPVFGARVAFAILGFVGLTTVLGYWLSEFTLGLKGEQIMPVIQALVTGMIVHSLVHRSHAHSESDWSG